MPLPIPDILEKAAHVILDCKQFKCSGNEEARARLDAFDPADLLAVLQEVGSVYTALHNMQITGMGSRPDLKESTLDIAVNVDFGLGPRTIIAKLPAEDAMGVVYKMVSDLAMIKPGAVVAAPETGSIILSE